MISSVLADILRCVKIGQSILSIFQKRQAVICSALACLLSLTSLQAQDYSKTGPKELVPENSLKDLLEDPLAEDNKDDEVIVSHMKGLVLLGSLEKVHKQPDPSITGVVVRDLQVPGKSGALEKILAPLIIDQPLTSHRISTIKQRILLYYKKYNHPVITILVPEQDVTDGILQLVIIESQADQVTATGARHFSNEMIKNQIHLKSGEPINTDRLLRDVAWLNQNPFRQTDVTFTPGSKPWTTDVKLVTRDRRPFRVYAGADNTGNEFTGNTRLFTGFNWGNVFNLDHLFSFQWTTSDDVKRFNAFTGSYSAPLPWRHVFNVFGGYSQVKPTIEHFKNEGWSAQASARYKIFLGKTYGRLLQDVNAGYDFKWTNNNLEFADQTSEAFVQTKVAQISQFLAIYHLGYDHGHHTVNFNLDYVFSPFQEWFRHHNKEAYQTLQPGSYPIYMYARAGVSELYRFSKYNWGVFFQGRGQISNRILLPSEQFGLGGYDTVRGYPERVVNYDNAVCLNLELRAPSLHVLKLFKAKKRDDSLVFLVFTDFGYGRPHKVENPPSRHLDPPGEVLASFGPGLRYRFKTYFTARADCGFPLTPIQGRPVLDPWFHFGLFASY